MLYEGWFSRQFKVSEYYVFNRQMLHRLTDCQMVDICFLAHSCISCSDRARVVGGLPDVVAIQEGKVNKLDIQCVNTMC